MLGYILFVCLLLICYSRRAPKAMLLVMVLFAVLRYDVGWDYVSYYNLSSDPSLLARAKDQYSFLWGWLFMWAYDWQCPHLAIAIPAFLTYVCIYFAVTSLLDNNQGNTCDSLLVYALWPFFYLSSFSTIRQYLAIAVFLLIYALMRKKKWIGATSLFCLNYFIHPSSLITIIFVPIVFLRKKVQWYWMALILIALVWAIGNWLDIVAMMNVETFNDYADTYEEFGANFGGTLSLLLGLLIVFFAIVMIFDRKMTIAQYNLMMVVIMTFVASIYIYNSGMSSVMVRVFTYFEILLVLIFMGALHNFPQPHIFRNLLVLMLVLLFFVFLQRTKVGAAQGLGTSGYLPYKTILFTLR